MLRQCTRSNVYALALLIATAAVLNAQNTQSNDALPRKTFDYKGDGPGEAFDQFSARHVDTGIECSGNADLLAKHGLKDKYEEIHRRHPLDNETTHTFYCSLKGPHQTLAGAEAYKANYIFFGDNLYEVAITTYGYGGDAYRNIKNAYIERFGQPARTATDTYQNGFGAISYGEHAIWLDPDHPYRIMLLDGPQHEYVSVELIDVDAEQTLQKLSHPKRTGDT